MVCGRLGHIFIFFVPIRHRPFCQVGSVFDFTALRNVLASVVFLILKFTDQGPVVRRPFSLNGG